LHGEFTQIMRNADLRQRLNALGYEITIGTSEQFGQRIRNEVAKWPNVVQAMGGPIN
jgi:tripartite-type tricarboxylate transporter receptor subunit TctC